MKKYKAIVFDMDGTVLDTLDELTKSLNYVFARHGLPSMTQKAIRPCLGFGYDGFIDKAAPDAAGRLAADDDGRIYRLLQRPLPDDDLPLRRHSPSPEPAQGGRLPYGHRLQQRPGRRF